MSDFIENHTIIFTIVAGVVAFCALFLALFIPLYLMSASGECLRNGGKMADTGRKAMQTVMAGKVPVRGEMPVYECRYTK